MIIAPIFCDIMNETSKPNKNIVISREIKMTIWTIYMSIEIVKHFQTLKVERVQTYIINDNNDNDNDDNKKNSNHSNVMARC